MRGVGSRHKSRLLGERKKHAATGTVKEKGVWHASGQDSMDFAEHHEIELMLSYPYDEMKIICYCMKFLHGCADVYHALASLIVSVAAYFLSSPNSTPCIY